MNMIIQGLKQFEHQTIHNRGFGDGIPQRDLDPKRTAQVGDLGDKVPQKLKHYCWISMQFSTLNA